MLWWLINYDIIIVQLCMCECNGSCVYTCTPCRYSSTCTCISSQFLLQCVACRHLDMRTMPYIQCIAENFPLQKRSPYLLCNASAIIVIKTVYVFNTILFPPAPEPWHIWCLHRALCTGDCGSVRSQRLLHRLWRWACRRTYIVHVHMYTCALHTGLGEF